jgi:hypothetical protein
MARYQATVASQSPAAETFGYLAAFSNAAERAAAGLTDALSRRPPCGGTRTAAAAPESSGGAAEPAGGRP